MVEIKFLEVMLQNFFKIAHYCALRKKRVNSETRTMYLTANFFNRNSGHNNTNFKSPNGSPSTTQANNCSNMGVRMILTRTIYMQVHIYMQVRTFKWRGLNFNHDSTLLKGIFKRYLEPLTPMVLKGSLLLKTLK